MSVAESVVEQIEGAGGVLAVNGERILIRLPDGAAHLVEELRAHKYEVLSLLRRREELPAMPPGVHLISWNLKEAPIAIEYSAVVIDPEKFARATLDELRERLTNPRRRCGWPVVQLIDRLAQVGVTVAVESEKEPQ